MHRLIFVTALTVALGATTLVAAQAPAAPRISAEQRTQRYLLTTMEHLLEDAVEHGAKVTRDRLQAIVPADMLLSDNARVRGYRLEGYGLFFDVGVPMLGGSLTWSFRTLDQHDLGLESALAALRSLVQKTGDTNLEQALTRIELQVAPMSLSAGLPGVQAPAAPGARTLTGSAAATAPDTAPPRPSDPILDDPEEAYRAEVTAALMDAMLDHGGALRIPAGELLTVAARGSDDRSVLGPLNDDAQTTMISVRGSDLIAYLTGQISREEVRNRMIVRTF